MIEKVVIDTNVVISALIQKNLPYHVVRFLLIDNRFKWCLSPEIFDEYEDVVSRPKFKRFPDFKENASALLDDVASFAEWFERKNVITVISDDYDNRFLELAVEANASYLITGNRQDFSMDHFASTKILTPK